jgi:signal transduction histidine kinase
MSRETAAIMEHAAGRVSCALGADLVGVFEYRGSRRGLLLRAGVGWHPEAIGRSAGGGPGSPLGRVLASGEPVIITDLSRARGPRLLRDHAVVSGIQTVIDGGSGPWGVLGAYARRPGRFSSDAADFLCVASDAISLALRCARLDTRLRATSQELERVQGDRERAIVEACRKTEGRTRAEITELLHDEALQSLLAARQQLAFAARRPERQDVVARARDGVQRAIRELREAVAGLHPVVLEGHRLTEAIHAVVARHAARGGFTADVELRVPAPEDCAPLVLSVIRELTANAAEHARASVVRVVLRDEGDDLVLEVADDGAGIAPGRLDVALAEGHIGLACTTRRAQALGGHLTVDTGPNRGTSVRVVLPGRATAGRDRPPEWPVVARAGGPL